MFCNGQLKSTGACLPPTQHINPKNGELRYYCVPMWDGGGKVGVYVRHLVIIEALA